MVPILNSCQYEYYWYGSWKKKTKEINPLINFEWYGLLLVREIEVVISACYRASWQRRPGANCAHPTVARFWRWARKTRLIRRRIEDELR